MAIHTVYQYILFTGFIIFFLFTVIQLSYRYKLPLNYFLAGLFLAGGYYLLYLWAYSLGLLRHIPLLINSDIFITFLLGPFFFLYFNAITGMKKPGHYKTVLHFIPFIVSLGIVLYFNLSDPSILVNYINRRSISPDYHSNGTVFFVTLISDISFACYIFATLINVSILFKFKNSARELMFMTIFLMLCLLVIFILLLANIIGSKVLAFTGVGLCTLLPVYYIIFSFRYPGFAMKVIKESRSMRYKKSMSKKQDSTLIESRLIQLMEEEKVFMREDLTLQSLSEILMVQPHNLSRILNERYNKTFNTFINTYRIEEAKRFLTLEPEKNILDIAYTAGFNSKSSFYTAFKKETGDTPVEYRKKMS